MHKEEAEKLIKIQEEFSEKTGNTCMLDVVGSTKEAMERFISFVADVTEVPFLVDLASVEVKIAGVEYVSEIGLEKRVIYNSLMLEPKREELKAVKESYVESAVFISLQRRFYDKY